MGNMSENFDIEDLMSYGDDLIRLLNVKNEIDMVSQCFEHSKALNFACDEDFNQIQGSIEDARRNYMIARRKRRKLMQMFLLNMKLNVSRKSSTKRWNKIVADELRDLNAQRISIDERRQSLKRKERDYLRAEKKLSMCASVTKVIPDIDDLSNISGYMVDREKRVIDKFRFETNKMTAYETCNSIWSTIHKQ